MLGIMDLILLIKKEILLGMVANHGIGHHAVEHFSG
jgi:hypothetical protein